MGKKATEVLSKSAKEAEEGEEIFEEEPNLEEEYNPFQTGIRTRAPQAKEQNKTYKIKKERKSRTYNPEDRFLDPHIKRYYLFPFHYADKFPFFKISWKYWKPNSVYKEMAHFLSKIPNLPGKTSIQCKSFDQRMKDIHYVSQNPGNEVDLLEAALNYLSQTALTQEDQTLIDSYLQRMSHRSAYVDFLLGGFSEGESEMEEGPVVEQKKEETCIESQNLELAFNEFLDVLK